MTFVDDLAVNNRVILRRVRDGRRRIIQIRYRPVDAEFTDAGLFYAYSRSWQRYQGRIVFIPFNELFDS